MLEKPYTKHIQQEGINLKIVAAAKKYKIVVRLKGGTQQCLAE